MMMRALTLWGEIIVVVASFLIPVTTCTSNVDAQTQPAILITGVETWDRIFASRTPEILLDGPANDLIWTEGPILVGNELIFSDTVGAKIYALQLDISNSSQSLRLRIIKERSGDAPPADDDWRAEPGSNGLAMLPLPSHMNIDIDGDEESSSRVLVLVCQHGAQRLAVMDLNTGEREPLATEYHGKRLNGPNDVAVRAQVKVKVKVADDLNYNNGNGQEKIYYAYFTDPVYAWLEKDRFEDLPYLNEKVKKRTRTQWRLSC
jgi:sugar lactone lactonase YvrE